MISARKICTVDGIFFYTNGILTDEEGGKKATQKIEKILSQQVQLHHNDSASKKKCIKIAGEISAGVGLTVYALHEEHKKKGTAVTRTMGIVGVILLLAGIKDYSDIQKDKNQHAVQIAKKIRQYCIENPYSPVNLVLHSQGADIGDRALESLEQQYRDRIRVVTLGGMVAIPEGMCQYVINFQLNADPVSGVVASSLNCIFKTIDGKRRKICQIQSDDGPFTHAVETYLNHPTVQKTLQILAQPNYFIKDVMTECWNPTSKLLKWENK